MPRSLIAISAATSTGAMSANSTAGPPERARRPMKSCSRDRIARALLDQLRRAAADRLGARALAIGLEHGIALEIDLVGNELQATLAGLRAAGEADLLLRQVDGADYVHPRAT